MSNVKEYTLKENINNKTNQVEVYFCDAGFAPLFKSYLNKNDFYFLGEDFSIGDISNINIDIKIDTSKSIRLWSSRKCIQEYLIFLYFCYKFEGKNISVVFVDDYLNNVWSIGATTSEEIPEMLKYERKLTETEINKYKEEWIRLVGENSELRFLKDKKVISVKYDYLNDYILKYYDKDDIKGTIGKLMGNDEDNNYSCFTYEFLVNRLMKK